MEHRRRTHVGRLFAVAILVSPLLYGAAAVAADRSAGALAQVDVAAGSVHFRPLAAYGEVQVTVTGPGGFEVVGSFAAGESAQVELPGSDGLYKYELRFAPRLSPQDRQRLAAARQAGEAHPLPGLALSDRQSVQRGWFRLLDGGVQADDLVEEAAASSLLAEGSSAVTAPPPPSNVVLTTSNGVIRNSLCVGFDCPNSPTFSDSTILLMENNTRIKFGDTSSAAGFPNNDWEIQANSNFSGGGNYLGINDCGVNDNDGGCGADLVFAIEAGAPDSSLWVESNGNVGFGTSTPVVDLHAISGNTPTLRLAQDGSAGFAPQTWDVAGNETNFFVRDVTSGSQLPLRIQPDTPTNTLFLENDSGDVGFGTSAPEEPIHVRRTDANAVNVLVDSTQNQNAQLRLRNGTGNTWDLRNRTNGEFAITLAGSGNTELNLDTAGNMEIFGELTTGGATCGGGGCDQVFSPGYDVPSIEEHAAEMWAKRHLPAIGPTPENQPFNLSQKTGGLIHELEKAHIYIEQLHGELARLRDRLTQVEATLAAEPAAGAVE